MIIVTARMKVKSGKMESFISKTQYLISSTRQEKGCISYNLYASTEEDDVLIMLEQWIDIKSSNEHMETDHFKKFGNTIEHFLEEKIEIKSYSAKEV